MTGNRLKSWISKRRFFFTLMEVMIGILLLTIASSVIGWKMDKAIEKKRFQSGLDRIKERFIVCQRLALTTEADWKGTFTEGDQGWSVTLFCEDGKIKNLPTLDLGKVEVFFNGKKVKKIDFDFFSTGQVNPYGVISFQKGSHTQEWKISEIFLVTEGKKAGLI